MVRMVGGSLRWVFIILGRWGFRASPRPPGVSPYEDPYASSNTSRKGAVVCTGPIQPLLATRNHVGWLTADPDSWIARETAALGLPGKQRRKTALRRQERAPIAGRGQPAVASS